MRYPFANSGRSRREQWLLPSLRQSPLRICIPIFSVVAIIGLNGRSALRHLLLAQRAAVDWRPSRLSIPTALPDTPLTHRLRPGPCGCRPSVWPSLRGFHHRWNGSDPQRSEVSGGCRGTGLACALTPMGPGSPITSDKGRRSGVPIESQASAFRPGVPVRSSFFLPLFHQHGSSRDFCRHFHSKPLAPRFEQTGNSARCVGFGTESALVFGITLTSGP